MPNPLIRQGTLNRVRGSVVFPSFPELNVTAPFLGKEGVSMALDGNFVDYLETMTGAVTSPAVYLMGSCTIRLLKTQNLVAVYKSKWEDDATVGDITIISDASTMPNFDWTNCSIANPGEMMFSGTSAEMTLVLRGYYIVNNSLFDQ